MKIASVNIGRAESIGRRPKATLTGICKYPVAGVVQIDASGLDGDAIVDKRHHGGFDQAVYVYSADDYRWWTATRGGEFFPGLFGENLTIEGLPSDLFIGDRLLIGDVVLEATSARIPCGTLATRMNDCGFGLAFRNAERPGIYFRVLNPGEVEAGDTVTLVETDQGGVTVLELFRFAYATSRDAEFLQRILAAPVAARVRAKVESALERL
jgi:MOSC domain-containing protein YiiM